MSIENALEDIRNGKIVLVYDFDDREKETDMTVASQYIEHSHICKMRKDAGGLLCTTTPYAIAKSIGLPYLTDVFDACSDKYPVLSAMAPNDIPYDKTRSSFGLTINHRKTYTGITDNDRALTIRSYADLIFENKPVENIRKDIGDNFRAPGHVHLLNTTEHILTDRKGHTELCTALMIMAGVKPSATICEMMGDDGNSMRKADTVKYAQDHGLAFVTGEEILKAWEKFKSKKG